MIVPKLGRLRAQWTATVAMVAVIATAGCSPKTPYDSHCDREQLGRLRARTIVLLVFQEKDHVLLNLEPLPSDAAKAVLAYHKATFVSEFGKFFTLIDQSAQIEAKHLSSQVATDPALAGGVVRRIGAEGGFVVTNGYAYNMAAGSLEDQLVGFFLEHFLPKKWVGVLSGASQVQDYDFASDVELINRDGRIVWRFYGKAQAWPTFSELLRPGEFVRSVAGLDPSNQSLARVMIQMSAAYTEFTGWMMLRDFDGNSGKNYWTDYLPGRPRTGLGIYPVEEEAYGPEVEGHSLLERNFPLAYHSP